MARADRVRRLALGLIGMAVLVAPTSAQEAKPTPKRFERLQKLETRWHDRPEAEREVLEERLRRFAALPEADRREVLERARVLREQEREWRKEMPPPLRRELDELPPEQRRERWQQHLRDRFRARGHELRDEIPPHVRERLERAPPHVRRRMLEDLRRHHRELGPGPGLPPLPPPEWERLPPGERLRRAREHFQRERGEGRRPHDRLPDGPRRSEDRRPRDGQRSPPPERR